MIQISDETARAVFDIATHSLDFGSGFLDDEQVTHLRQFAKFIGVDPWLATPDNHKPKYCLEHNWVEVTEQFSIPGKKDIVIKYKCTICNSIKDWHGEFQGIIY